MNIKKILIVIVALLLLVVTFVLLKNKNNNIIEEVYADDQIIAESWIDKMPTVEGTNSNNIKSVIRVSPDFYADNSVTKIESLNSDDVYVSVDYEEYEEKINGETIEVVYRINEAYSTKNQDVQLRLTIQDRNTGELKLVKLNSKIEFVY